MVVSVAAAAYNCFLQQVLKIFKKLEKVYERFDKALKVVVKFFIELEGDVKTSALAS